MPTANPTVLWVLGAVIWTVTCAFVMVCLYVRRVARLDEAVMRDLRAHPQLFNWQWSGWRLVRNVYAVLVTSVLLSLADWALGMQVDRVMALGMLFGAFLPATIILVCVRSMSRMLEPRP